MVAPAVAVTDTPGVASVFMTTTVQSPLVGLYNAELTPPCSPGSPCRRGGHVAARHPALTAPATQRSLPGGGGPAIEREVTAAPRCTWSPSVSVVPDPSSVKISVVNRVLWRVGAIRAAWVLVPIWLFVACAGAVSGGTAPWALLYGFFTAFGVLVAIVGTVSDRRLAVRAGRADAPWRGYPAFSLPVETSVAPEHALAIARRAVAMTGGSAIELVEPTTVIGWIGSVWTNAPQKQQYELAVAVMAGTGGGIEFVCCARPRFSSAAFGAAKCQLLAELLQSAVVSLALDEGDAA